MSKKRLYLLVTVAFLLGLVPSMLIAVSLLRPGSAQAAPLPLLPRQERPSSVQDVIFSVREIGSLDTISLARI